MKMQLDVKRYDLVCRRAPFVFITNNITEFLGIHLKEEVSYMGRKVNVNNTGITFIGSGHIYMRRLLHS